jgi:hypothetical protein
MSLESIKIETEQLKTVDVNTLSPDQLTKLVDKIANIIEASEKQLTEIKIEINEG